MEEYKAIEVQSTAEETEALLNSHALDGWRLVCSYCEGMWLIMSRTKFDNGGNKHGRRNKESTNNKERSEEERKGFW